MQIKILTEAQMNDAVTAWALSRDPQADYDVTMIAGVDAPVMEMPSCVLAFEDFMILEREIFCSLRNHVVWARTSRVDDPRCFTVPDTLRDPNHEVYRKKMINEANDGAKQDTWRTQLPLVAHTSWTQRISLRDLARLTVYFGRLSSLAKWRPLAVRFSQLQYELTKSIVEMIGAVLAHKLLDNQPVIKFLFEKGLPLNNELYPIGNFKQLRCPVTIALRAQIIRHREIQFVDNYWELINTDQLPMLQLSHQVRMQMTARNDVWHAICSKRACWIAQADLWQPIIIAFGKQPPLPCDNGKCPYEIDARARLETGKDPNPPCPVFCNLYHIPKDQYRDVIMKEAKQRGQFWIDQVNT